MPNPRTQPRTGEDNVGRIGLTDACFAIAAEHGDRMRAGAHARTTHPSVVAEDRDEARDAADESRRN